VLLPMLHPGYEQHMGDICVSARTGSGKTLAYLLPIVEALKDQAVTTLSAIVVVPTRQLVDQALKVAEDLCTGTKLRVGTALGNVPFATEQKQLVKLRAQYDPARARELHKKASQQLPNGISQRSGIFNDLATMPANHIPHYNSGVDILICTPGRLVEHIENTTGFLLRSVKWLVIDEADQLLTQNFQGWATVLLDALHSETPEDFMSFRERFCKRREGTFSSIALQNTRQITKIVLSATMKKDLTKLGMLRLRRPRLVVVEDEKDEQPLATDNDVFELPLTLNEFAIQVGNGSNKPLYLLYLLLQHIFVDEIQPRANSEKKSIRSDSTSDRDSSSNSHSESSLDSDSDSDGDRNLAVGAKKGPHLLEAHKNRVLVFTKSNENASRLSHLLTYLEPSLTPYLTTMTPSSTAKQTAKILRNFSTGKTKILIASDAASRGLDIPSITHVVNYDIPPSITSYVHRIGRTARAGKSGMAWTLFTKLEAGWFWNVIARGESVRRGHKTVKRVEFKDVDVTKDRIGKYQEALKSLQGAVEGNAEGA
jgi:ATP-dependent RNA helicase DDX51/DBP6